MTGAQAGSASRPDLPKEPMLLRKPRTAIAIDELLLFASPTLTVKCLVGICMFSHYTFVKLVKNKNVTSSILVEFLNQLKLFCGQQLQYIVTDTDMRLESRLVHESCDKLGLTKLSTAAYNPKANLAELSNKLILKVCRNLLAQHSMTLDLVEHVLTKGVILLNETCFTNHKTISPSSLMFGCIPNSDPKDLLFPENIHESYFQASLSLYQCFSKIRSRYLDQRRQESQQKLNGDPRHANLRKIKEGSLVTVRNMKQKSGGSQKLQPLYSGLYKVVVRTPSSCFISPISGNNVLKENYESSDQRLVLIKTDVTNLKLISNPVLTPSLQDDFFANFSNYAPRPLYLSSHKGGSVMSWEQLYPNKTLNQYQATIKLLETNSEEVTSKTLISYRDLKLKEISDHFRSLTGKVQKSSKKVRFAGKIKMCNYTDNPFDIISPKPDQVQYCDLKEE